MAGLVASRCIAAGKLNARHRGLVYVAAGRRFVRARQFAHDEGLEQRSVGVVVAVGAIIAMRLVATAMVIMVVTVDARDVRVGLHLKARHRDRPGWGCRCHGHEGDYERARQNWPYWHIGTPSAVILGNVSGADTVPVDLELE
jgi:hypothetical protein